MRDKQIIYFSTGFAFATATVGLLYWLWRQNRAVTPKPLIVTRMQPKDEVAATERPESTIADSLESIRGIGPVSARRLNDAGIYTYAQLAELTPEQVEDITGSGRWDPANWIAEARQLANSG